MLSEKSSYKDICAFLDGKTDNATTMYDLENIIGYGIFFEIQQKSESKEEVSSDSHITYSDIETYLEHYLAGNLSNQEAQILKNAILGSEKVFIKLKRKIDGMSKTVSASKIYSLTQFNLTDQDLTKTVLEKDSSFDDEVPSRQSFSLNNNTVISAILASAAVFLIIFIFPFEIQQDLSGLYNYDLQSPLNYHENILRGTSTIESYDDPDYRFFQQQFKQGMSGYLVQDYRLALKEWQKLDDKLPALREKEGFVENEEQQLKLYSAISLLSLGLSEKEELIESQKSQSLMKALSLFRDMTLANDTTKYYFALTLAVTENEEEAQQILKDINPNSSMYGKKVILHERLNQ